MREWVFWFFFVFTSMFAWASDDFSHPFIGRGSSGSVYRTTFCGRDAVVKIIPRDETNDVLFKNEVAALKTFAHPKIVSLLGYVSNKNNNKIFLEALDGDLLTLINKGFFENHQNDSQLSALLLDVLSALAYMHAAGIAHYDVKSENILCSFSEGVSCAKLADLAYADSPEDRKTRRGSGSHVAPDVFMEDCLQTVSADMWSFGLVIADCFKCNFQRNAISVSIESEQKAWETLMVFFKDFAQDPNPYYQLVPERYRELVRELVCFDRDKRISAKQAFVKMQKIQTLVLKN